jgi:hypothetical protein
MKTLALFLIYTATWMGVFFLLSLIGLLWNDSYYAVISDHTWFMMYSLFFGWWISIFPAREYYKHNEEYFQELM